jgi:hypothetical protein
MRFPTVRRAASLMALIIVLGVPAASVADGATSAQRPHVTGRVYFASWISHMRANSSGSQSTEPVSC